MNNNFYIKILLLCLISINFNIISQWNCLAPTPVQMDWTSVDAPTFYWIPAAGNPIHCGSIIECTLCYVQNWMCGPWCGSTIQLFTAAASDSCYTLPVSVWMNGFVYDSNQITTFWFLSSQAWANNHLCGGHIRRLPASLPPCNLISPANGQSGISITPLLKWSHIDSAASYRVRIYSTRGLTGIKFDSIITRDSIRVPAGKLNYNSTYWWRVKAYKTGGEGPLSDANYFSTAYLGVNQLSSEIPMNFSLYQNYPNPFNPVTKIRFDVPSLDSRFRGNENVVLIIYDILGHEITTLVNEKLQPGTYEAEFDGTNYPSGVYYYKINIGSFTQTNKMVLIK